MTNSPRSRHHPRATFTSLLDLHPSRHGFLLLAAAAILPLAAGGKAPATAGPLVGEVTPTTASLWIYAPAGESVVATYFPEGDRVPEAQAKFDAVEEPAADLPGRPARAYLTGLAPATRYFYQVSVDGKTDLSWAGSFRTAPPQGEGSSFRVALTSCMKIGQPQASWYLLLAQQPDLHLTVGDTHYADTTEPSVQWEHHLRYRRQKEHATVLRNVPTYSMWDDHDYGPNDSDGTAAGKENSLAGWTQFWANPGAGTAATPGAFYRFSYGEVDFFVVDGRYHRSPDKAPDDENKTMLGEAQFAWLVDGLKRSRAKFKVIASGSTLNHSKGDGWRVYTHARHRLFDAIRENRVRGVLYFSGDIHQSLVWEHHESQKRVGYPLVEVISSGVANSKTLSFATVDFDTAQADPTVRVRIVHGDGTVRDDRRWRLSQLGGGGR